MTKKKQNVQFLAPFTHLDNVLLEFIRMYFLYHPVYTWNEDDTKTVIKIVKNFNKLGNDANFYPRIVLKRGSSSLTMPTMLSNYAGGGTLMKFTQMRTKFYRAGSPYFIDIYCRVPGEAQNLAEELMVQILLFKDRLAERFFVNIEEHMEVTPEIIESGGTPDFVYSRVTLTLLASYTYQVKYNIVPRYEVMKGLDIESNLEKAVERRNEIDFKNLKFNTIIEGND